MNSTGKLLTPFRVVMLFTIVVVLGIAAVPGMSVHFLPPATGNTLTVSFSLSNAGPLTVEMEVTSVLENYFSVVTDVEHQQSSSYNGGGYIRLQFAREANMDEKRFEVAGIIRRVYNRLPAGCSYPVISGGSAGNERQTPTLVYTVTAPYQPFRIRQDLFQKFVPTLQDIREVSEVQVSGTPSFRINLLFDQARLHATGVQPNGIIGAINEAFRTSYPGAYTTGEGASYFLRFNNQPPSITDLENLLIPLPAGKMVPLKELVSIRKEEEEQASWFRVNGKNAVNVSIYLRTGVNESALAKAIRKRIDHTKVQLPAGYDVHLEFDDTVHINEAIRKNNYRTLLSAGILLLFVLTAYRSWRHLLAITASVVLSIFCTILGARLLGVPLHLYSIAAVTVSFGLITDNAIVMLDHLRRHNNRDIITALLAASLTTMTALAVIFLLPVEERQNLDDFCQMVIISLVCSLMVNRWFSPALYRLLFRNTGGRPVTAPFNSNNNRYAFYFRTIRLLKRFRVLIIVICVFVFGIPLFLLPGRLNGNEWYHRWYNATLGNDWYRFEVRPKTDKWLGGLLYRFKTEVFEKGHYRSPQQTRLYVQAQLPGGSAPAQLNTLFQSLEQHLANDPGVEKMVTNIYGVNGSVVILFKAAYDKTGWPYAVKQKVTAFVAGKGGVAWNIYGVGDAFTINPSTDLPSFLVKMKGYQYDQLEKQATILAEKLLRHERIQKVNTDENETFSAAREQEYILKFDAANLAMYNLNEQLVFSGLYTRAKPSGPATQLVLDNNFVPVWIQEKEADAFSFYDVHNQPVVVEGNRNASIKNAAQLTLQPVSSAIRREDRSYVRVVSFQYLGEYRFGTVYLDSVLNEMRAELPAGYTVERMDRIYRSQESSHHYGLLILLAFAIYCICSMLFEQLRQPFFIILVIPLSFIGLFLTFVSGGFFFDQGGYAAFLMLSGIVVNAAIFITNDHNRIVKAYPQQDVNRLLIAAHFNRMRTTLLTTLSVCCSLTPFLLEGQHEVFWFSFASGTIGGLLFSLPVIFILLPLLLWKGKAKQR